jgi:hypothetical protein
MWFWLYFLVAALISSFLFWKLYKNDFEEEDVFSHFLTTIFISGIFGYFVGEWGVVFGFLLTLGCWCYYKKWDFGEWLDHWILVVLPWVAPVHYYAFGVWVTYESGRIGFSGLSSVILWGLTKAIVAIITPQTVYWLGLSVDQWLGVWLAVGGIVSLYLRSGRKIWRKKT